MPQGPVCRKGDDRHPTDPKSPAILYGFRTPREYQPVANPANPRISGSKSPVWDSAKTITTAVGPAVLLPVRYTKSLHIPDKFTGQKLFDLNELTHLLIYQDPSRHYHSELVTVFPDSLALQPGRTQFSGILFVEDWAGSPLRQYKVQPRWYDLASDPSQVRAAKTIGLAPTSSNPIVPRYRNDYLLRDRWI